MSGHGRPPSKDPKTNTTQIRMSENDIAMLEYCCQKTGKSKAYIIRIGIQKVYDELKEKE